MIRKIVCFVACATALDLGASAEDLVPGSLLVYPTVSTTTFTAVSVTNTNLFPVTPLALGGTTKIHFQFVNLTTPNIPSHKGGNGVLEPWPTDRDGGVEAIALGCHISDFVETLTPADTLTNLAGCVNPSAGGEGYLVVTALDPITAQPWSHNHLIGSEFCVRPDGSSFALPAIAFQSPLAAALPTDLDADGQRDFDGIEYSQVPDMLFLDSVVASTTAQIALIGLSGGAAFATTIRIDAWNDNEQSLSATFRFNCWADKKLVNISLIFHPAFLANNTFDDPTEADFTCDGVNDVETCWARFRGSIATSTAQSITDPAILGAITGGATDSGRPLWHTQAGQSNGDFLNFGSFAF